MHDRITHPMHRRVGQPLIVLAGSLLLLGALLITMPGCNTVKGIGRDIEAAGQNTEDWLHEQ